MATTIPDRLTLEVMSHEPGHIEYRTSEESDSAYARYHPSCAKLSAVIDRGMRGTGAPRCVVIHHPNIPVITECSYCKAPLHEQPQSPVLAYTPGGNLHRT